MNTNHRLWRWLGLIFVLSFGALGFIGYQIYLTAPPIPKAVVSADGDVIFTGAQVQAGQQAWLSSGGQQVGSVWGHGAYVAPDWSADWLHREALALQALRTQQHTNSQPTLSRADRAAIDAALKGVWLRVPGDIVFAAGAVLLAVYALRLLRRPDVTATTGAEAPNAGRLAA